MNKKLFLILIAAIVVATFGFDQRAYTADADPCSLLQDPVTKGKMSAALERKLMLLCGEATREELYQRRREIVGEAAIQPPYVPDIVAGKATTESEIAAPGTDILVNNPALDTGGTTQSETTIVAVGNIVCAAWNDAGEGFGANGFSGFGYSSDGGNTWTDGGPFPNGPGPTFDSNGGDPSLAYRDLDNAFYYAALSDLGLSLWKSTTNCQTFSYVGPIHVGGGDDKEIMAIDNNPASPYYGRMYVAWTDFNFGGRIRSTYSTDGGVTWSAPVTLSGVGVDVQGAWPAVAPNGDVYVAWVRWNPYPWGNIDIEVVRSTNGGASFSFRTNPLTNAVNPRENADTIGCGRPALNGDIRYLPSPQIVVGPSGTVHIVYSYDPDGFNVGDVVDVFYRRSTDQAASWGPQVQLNDDTTSTDQWFPAIAVNQNDELVASWYDRRLDTVGNMNFDRYATLSMDDGLTWGANIRISDVSSPVSVNNPHFDGLNTCYHGDYDQLAMDANTAHILWSDDRRITGSGPNPDVYYDFISLQPTEPAAISFDPPCAFSETVPMQIYMNTNTNALFIGGNGAVLNECSNFDVIGQSPPYFLAWNANATNQDGSVPALPETIYFPNTVSSVSMNVGVGFGVTGTAVLIAYDAGFNIVDYATAPISQTLQNLTVNAAAIRLVVLLTTDATDPVLVADDLSFN
jgi:hypothetical protein